MMDDDGIVMGVLYRISLMYLQSMFCIILIFINILKLFYVLCPLPYQSHFCDYATVSG